MRLLNLYLYFNLQFIFKDPFSDDLYTCDCTSGFTGQDCETKKDFCIEFNEPCQNGATCISIDSTYVSR